MLSGSIESVRWRDDDDDIGPLSTSRGKPLRRLSPNLQWTRGRVDLSSRSILFGFVCSCLGVSVADWTCSDIFDWAGLRFASFKPAPILTFIAHLLQRRSAHRLNVSSTALYEGLADFAR